MKYNLCEQTDKTRTDDGVWGWQWHQLDHMQQSAPRSRQITTPTPHHSIFTGRMLFLTPTNSVKALKPY